MDVNRNNDMAVVSVQIRYFPSNEYIHLHLNVNDKGKMPEVSLGLDLRSITNFLRHCINFYNIFKKTKRNLCFSISFTKLLIKYHLHFDHWYIFIVVQYSYL